MNENPAARAARLQREKRHRREVLFWKAPAIVLLVTVWVLVLWGCPHQPQEWREDQAPCGHPVEVITKGYVDKKGNWRSFSNGEKIEVTAWKP